MANWISCDDRLPEVHELVLAFSNTKDSWGYYFASRLLGKELIDMNDDAGECPVITHWMPLPEPPDLHHQEA